MSADALERCLGRATRFLPSRIRREVRAELHANLYQAMLDARLQGLNEADAWAAAVRESGSAWRLALQLARVHTLGLALRVLLAGMVLGGAAYAVRAEVHSAPTGQEARP